MGILTPQLKSTFFSISEGFFFVSDGFANWDRFLIYPSPGLEK
jgi:hypothetical protein